VTIPIGVCLIILSVISIYFILFNIINENNIEDIITNKINEKNTKLKSELNEKIFKSISNINKKEDDIKEIKIKLEQLQINISTLSITPRSTGNVYKHDIQFQSEIQTIDNQIDKINLKLIELEREIKRTIITPNEQFKSSNDKNSPQKIKYTLDYVLEFWNNNPFNEESCLQWCKKHDWSVQFINDIFSLWNNNDSNYYLFVKRGVQFSRIKWAYDCNNTQNNKNVERIKCPTELSITADMIEKWGPKNTWLDKIESMINKKGIVEVEI
jgi:hypothetical protein